MSKLTKLEEVALSILNGKASKHGHSTRGGVEEAFRMAEIFLSTSPDFKVKEITVKGHVEIINYDADSMTISANDIHKVLEETESELHERQVLSPVHAMETVVRNLAKMSKESIEKANATQFGK